MSDRTAEKLLDSESTPIEPGRRQFLKPVIFICLGAIIAVAPLLLGSARPLAWDVEGLCISLLLIIGFLCSMNEERIFEKYLLVPILLFTAVITFVVIQVIPWVPGALQNPVWGLASETLNRGVNGAIAADRQAAMIGIFRLLCYAGVFYLTVVLCREPGRADAAVKLVAISGSIYATYGLFIYWSGNKTILWFSKWAYPLDLTGTFVNRNSFATYLGLCTLASLCLLLQSFMRIELHGDWQRKLISAIEFTSARIGKMIVLFILMTALFLTHSRGGLMATLSGMAALMFMIAMAPSLGKLRRIGAWGVVPFVVFLIALFISGSGTFYRMMSVDLDAEQRLATYRLIVQAIWDYPIRGIGLGSFAYFFPIYRTSDIFFYFDFAHNDYLQNLLELGIPAGICLFAAIGWLTVICLHGVRIRQRDAIYPCLAVAASILVGLHSMVDFSLQIPAVTITYIFLLGIGVAQSRSSRVNIVK